MTDPKMKSEAKRTAEKELAWICAIMPEDYIRRIKTLCIEANRGIGLSEKVFKFPLHISLKKSFLTDRFPEVLEEMRQYFTSRGAFTIKVSSLVKHEGMLWLDIERTPELLRVHAEIDSLLEKRFGIPLHRFDKHFEPHISLFTDRDEEKISEMYEAIRDDFYAESLTIRKIVVGADRERDTFIDI